MAVNRAELLNLPLAEQLEIIELLWDNLGSSTSPISLPDWVGIEEMRRLSEMKVITQLSGKVPNSAMTKAVRYHPLFSSVNDVADWYESRSKGLGQEFVASVHRAAISLIEDPERFAVFKGPLRSLRIRRFPYAILFSVTDKGVLILGALHTARPNEK